MYETKWYVWLRNKKKFKRGKTTTFKHCSSTVITYNWNCYSKIKLSQFTTWFKRRYLHQLVTQQLHACALWPHAPNPRSHIMRDPAVEGSNLTRALQVGHPVLNNYAVLLSRRNRDSNAEERSAQLSRSCLLKRERLCDYLHLTFFFTADSSWLNNRTSLDQILTRKPSHWLVRKCETQSHLM